MDRLDLLRIFLRIADSGSFTRAAEQLGLPRATVSVAVRQLESNLGVRLLHRTTRRVGLTPDGEALRVRAAVLVDDMEALERQFRPAGANLTGRLRVDAPSRIARRFIVPAWPDFLARHPGIELELGAGDRLVDLAREGVDCALRVGALASSSLVARPLGAFEMINCASPSYLAQHGMPKTTDGLDGHWAIDYGQPSGVRSANWEWLEDGQPRSRRMASRLSVNHVETYIAGALAGLGLIQVPRFDVREHLAAGELIEVMPAARPAPMPVHLVYPHRQHLPGRVHAFLDWIAELLAPHLRATGPAGAPPSRRARRKAD
ncbi:MAG: LysR family transcriptional regulator [Thiobacillus sp. 65-69]|nr:LysR family transcriptional regulator [Thiobacillus sp.]ODU89803.1 MAG: LysR family transcriptional regulator [Thiobacillus sp. SCN 65-179]OJW37731.1 MAG: LysR family transcriptional regulator [Thiobacillus sp. 65-69]